jgi:hypothetical protein
LIWSGQSESDVLPEKESAICDSLLSHSVVALASLLSASPKCCCVVSAQALGPKFFDWLFEETECVRCLYSCRFPIAPSSSASIDPVAFACMMKGISLVLLFSL